MNRLPQEKIDTVFECFRASLGIRATARKAGVSRRTAATYLKLFESEQQCSVLCLCGKPRHRGWCKAQENAERVEAFCGCGKPLRHRGWCSVRFARSPERQQLLKRIGRGRRAIAPPAPSVVECTIPTFTEEERRDLGMRRRQVQQRAKKQKPLSKTELAELIASSGVAIKRYPLGAHAGWRPSWLEQGGP